MERKDIIQTENDLNALAYKLAGNSFPAFLLYANRNYSLKWFHRYIAEKCQQVYEGKVKKMMIFMPPQHGKSEVVSRAFPAWLLGKNPSLKICEASYSSDLAEQFSLSIQRIIDSREYQRLFRDTYLNGTQSEKHQTKISVKGARRNVDFFETVEYGGFYKAVGVCGSLTGTPVDIGIIDDPVKDALEAASATYRNRVWEWYTNVFLTRLHNHSRQLLIMTRWHSDDLAGRLLDKEGEEWDVVTIPAIKENNSDPNDPRQIGEALWEERHSREKLLSMEKLSPKTYNSLYQQRPTVDGGNIIKAAWFRTVSLSDFNKRRRTEPMVFFMDSAYTSNGNNDPTGIIATCRIGNDMYIYNAVKVYKNFPELIRFIPVYVKQNGYSDSSSIRIEPKANGLSIIDQLREYSSLNVTKTPTPKDDKTARLNAASPSVECGRVVLVEGSWNDLFVEEVCGFPAQPHDEFVDVLSYAVEYHLTRKMKPIDVGRLSGIV